MKRPRKSQAFAPPSRAGSLDLVGGALALDLTNTSSGRGTPGHQEHLRDFDTVMQWVAHARILTPGDCAITLNCFTSGNAIAGALPRNMRGKFGPIATARNGDACSSGMLSIARFNQPSSVAFNPGVPDSIKSCASKCERVGSGDPAA